MKIDDLLFKLHHMSFKAYDEKDGVKAAKRYLKLA